MARERELHLLLLGNPRMGGGSWRLPGLRNDTALRAILRLVIAPAGESSARRRKARRSWFSVPAPLTGGTRSR
jgi:hypothetical protein